MTFDQLYADAMRLTSVDLKAAAQAARKVKKAASSEPRHAGLSARLLGHIAFLQSKYRVAKEHYELSVRLFESANLMLEAAITRSGAVLTLTYLAEYTQLQGWVDQARAEFESTQDRARLARLDGNLAFGLFRQDKFAEALAMYERVLKELLETGRPVDVSTALWNKATCLISLGDYAAAGRAHLEARSYAEANKLPLQTAAIDYNVAYLHYLCGDYTDAMALYDVARRTGEPYRRALCDLDEAEMFLELNLHREAAGLAQRAMRAFQRLAMPYEQGKAIAFRGIAQGQLGLGRQALRTFGAARRTFLRERNDVWLALLDLYQAILLDRLGMTRKARQLAEKAHSFFSASDFPAKAVTAELLLARLDFRAGALLTALNRCTSAGAAVPATGSPSLEYQVAQLRAEILEAMMRRAEAREAYETARQLLERLRFRLRGDEIKVAFLKNKLSVYESLFWLTLTDRSQPDRVARAFAVAETAKSRSMAEQVQASANASAGSSEVLEIRRELDAVYQRIQRVEADAGTSLDIARQQRATLRNRSRRLETQLAGRLAALEGLSGGQALPLSGTDPGALRAWLPEGVQVVEYFVSRDTVFAFLLDRGTLRVWPLAPVQRVQRLARFLRLQLRGSRTALHAHLRSMYDELLEPLRSSLTGDHLVIIPHGALHSIPFSALHDGTSYLLDRYAISYAPSADLLRITTERPASSGSQSLVVGVADAQAPLIEREARTLAGILPNAKLLLGPEASFTRLREEAKNSRIVHLAAHGFVQRENPLFSAIRLANSWLTVFDLYRCSIPADLVTLSGCSTGLNEVVGGDELVGLLRGLLQAGARNALVSLWDVDDGSTTQFMESFYRGMLLDGLSPTDALRTASLDLRKTYEDPYHWAAFHLVGLGKKL